MQKKTGIIAGSTCKQNGSFKTGKDSNNSFNGTGNTQNIYNGNTQNFETAYAYDSEREQFYRNVNRTSKGVFRFAKKNAWFVGIYIAVIGLIFMGFGFAVRYMSNSFINNGRSSMEAFANQSAQMMQDNNNFSGMGGDNYDTEDNYDIEGDVSDEEFDNMLNSVGVSKSDLGLYDKQSDSVSDKTSSENAFSNVFDIGNDAFTTVTSIVILLGLLLTVFGVFLAVVLRVKLRNKADMLT